MNLRLLSALLLIGAVAWFAGATGTPKTSTNLSPEEQALKQAGVPLDSFSLLDHFRRRTPTEQEQAVLKRYAAQLGSSSFAVRDRATKELIRAGQASLPLLRPLLKSKDIEAVQRAGHCLRAIEAHIGSNLSVLASRVLAERKVPGAAEVLLAYLPWSEEDWALEEIRQSLKSLAMEGGKAAAFLETSLTDAEPRRRGAAAWLVGQSIEARQRQRAMACLLDEVAEVRFLTATGLLAGGEREPAAVPVLIRLLEGSSPEIAWRCEDMLFRLAGEKAPQLVWLDTADHTQQSKVRQAWESWWKTHEASVDWKALHEGEQALGLTLVIENQRPDGGGRLYEVGSAGQIRWQVRIQNPIDAQWLPGGRLLVADTHASQVYEMDVRGVIGWKQNNISPTSCQRLPNGNTVVSTYQSIIEFTRDNKIVFTYNTQGHTYHARKLPNGHYVWIDACGEIAEIDAKGKEIAKLSMGSGLTWGSIERLRNGHYLVALGGVNKVREIDLAGKVYWEKSVNNPNRAVRLANGHTLVSSHGDHCVYEFDSQGKERWKHDCTGRPFASHRR